MGDYEYNDSDQNDNKMNDGDNDDMENGTSGADNDVEIGNDYEEDDGKQEMVCQFSNSFPQGKSFPDKDSLATQTRALAAKLGFMTTTLMDKQLGATGVKQNMNIKIRTPMTIQSVMLCSQTTIFGKSREVS